MSAIETTAAALRFAEIRDKALYHHVGYGSWTEYCEGRWGLPSDLVDAVITRETGALQ